jgi:uncharacterized protein
MKRILFVTICIIALTSTALSADEASRKEAVLKLLEVTNTRNMLDQVTKSVEGMMKQQVETVSADLSPEGREVLEGVRKESMKWWSENFSWDQMKDMYTNMYTQVFTEDEINELVQFYQSPLGQKILKKMPELTQAIMQTNQAVVQKKMPAFRDRIEKTMADIEARYNTTALQPPAVPSKTSGQDR